MRGHENTLNRFIIGVKTWLLTKVMFGSSGIWVTEVLKLKVVTIAMKGNDLK